MFAEKTLHVESHSHHNRHHRQRQEVGQFGTGQFGTKIINRTIWHKGNKNGQFGTKIIKVENLAPGQFGTRTIWDQTFDMIKLNLVEDFWQHFGQKFSFGVIVCLFGHKYG